MGTIILNIQAMIKRWIFNYKKKLRINKQQKEDLEKQIKEEIKKQNEFALIRNYKIKKYSKFEIITKVSIGMLFSFLEYKLTENEEDIIKNIPQNKILEDINFELTVIEKNNIPEKVIENYNKVLKTESKLKDVKTDVLDKKEQKLLEVKKETIKLKTEKVKKEIIIQTNFITSEEKKKETEAFFIKNNVVVPTISIKIEQNVKLKVEQKIVVDDSKKTNRNETKSLTDENKTYYENIKKEKIEDTKKDENKKVEEDFILAKALINKNILKQQKLLNDLNKSINKMNIFSKKRTIFDNFNIFLSNTFNFAVSIFPIKLFSNKLLGGLISTIMLNNSIKTMRFMISKQKINYSFFDETKDLIEQYKIINNDTIDQISYLKQEVLSIYNDYNKDEIKPILEQILGIEEVVLKQQVKLEKLNNKLENDKQKIIRMGL